MLRKLLCHINLFTSTISYGMMVDVVHKDCKLGARPYLQLLKKFFTIGHMDNSRFSVLVVFSVVITMVYTAKVLIEQLFQLR